MLYGLAVDGLWVNIVYDRRVNSVLVDEQMGGWQMCRWCIWIDKYGRWVKWVYETWVYGRWIGGSCVEGRYVDIKVGRCWIKIGNVY